MTRESNVVNVSVMQVVCVISLLGDGTDKDPVRTVVEYYDVNDGTLLARVDGLDGARNELE